MLIKPFSKLQIDLYFRPPYSNATNSLGHMIKNSTLLQLILFLFLPASFFAQSSGDHSEGPFDQLIIRGATLINGNGAPPTGPVDIVIEGNQISAIKVVGYPGVTRLN